MWVGGWPDAAPSGDGPVVHMSDDERGSLPVSAGAEAFSLGADVPSI
jgi:hypothetical protein